MNRKAVYGLLIALLLPIIGYFIVKYYAGEAVVLPRHFIYDSVNNRTVKGKLVSDTVWHQLPDFTLTNQLGQTVSWKDMEGKTVVADFFFTRCPTICPKLTGHMKLLQNYIKSSSKVGSRDPDFVHFLSFSVDPERDSVQALKKWADRFQINPANWWLLTGKKKDIYDLSIDHMKLGLIDGNGIDTGFMHTDYMVLIDKYRRIRGYYHGLDTTEVQELARDIIFLTLERDPKRKSIFSGQLALILAVLCITIVGLAVFVFVLKKWRLS